MIEIWIFFCDLSGDHINGKLQLTLNWLASIMPCCFVVTVFVCCRLLGRAWESAELPGDPHPPAGLRIHCQLKCLLTRHLIPAEVGTFSCIKHVQSSLSTLPTGEVTYIEALYFCFMTAIRSPPKDVKNCFPRSYKNISGQEMCLASQGPSLVAVTLYTCYGIWIVARPRELGQPYIVVWLSPRICPVLRWKWQTSGEYFFAMRPQTRWLNELTIWLSFF